MGNNQNEYKNLIYLNKQRLMAINSKEMFCGKKFVKYTVLMKKAKFLSIIKELFHDINALINKNVSDHIIIDFEKNAVKKFNRKVIVYTCIYGDYDEIMEPLCIDPNCEYFIFTDKTIPSGSIWKKGCEDNFPKECDTPAKRNRYVKMFPYKFFECEYSIYLDGNLQIVGYPSHLVQKKLSSTKTGIGMHLAPRENCIYDEAKTVCHVGKITKKERNVVLNLYTTNSMPHHYGMCECNVIIREHSNMNMKQIMEKWWQYYSTGVKRDQLYFTFVLYMLGYEFTDVLNFGASVNQNYHFLRKEHI